MKEEDKYNLEEDDVEEVLVRYEKSESQEVTEKVEGLPTVPWYINGGPDMVQQREKLLQDAQEEEEPPSPPPRVESVRNSPPQADHFLGEGRGGEHGKTAPPHLPPPTQVSQFHQPRPQKESAPVSSNFNEEEALINELNELEKIVSQHPSSRTEWQQKDKEGLGVSQEDKMAE